MFWIITEYAILASTFTLAKIVVSVSTPLFLLTVRMLIAATLLLGYARIKYRLSLHELLRDTQLFVLAGLFHAYLAFVPEFWALQYVSSARASLLYGLTPFFAALMSAYIEQEKLTKRQKTGMLLAFSSLVPFILSRAGEEGVTASQIFSFGLAELALIGAVISATFAWFIVKKLMSRGHKIPTINGVAFGIGGVLCAFSFFVIEYIPGSNPVSDPTLFWPTLGMLIVIAHLLSYPLYSWLLKRYSITFVTLCGFLSPLFAGLYGVLFLGEKLSGEYGCALIGLIIGLWLFTAENKIHEEKYKK